MHVGNGGTFPESDARNRPALGELMPAAKSGCLTRIVTWNSDSTRKSVDCTSATLVPAGQDVPTFVADDRFQFGVEEEYFLSDAKTFAGAVGDAGCTV